MLTKMTDNMKLFTSFQRCKENCLFFHVGANYSVYLFVIDFWNKYELN